MKWEKATDAYKAISGSDKPLLALLTYPGNVDAELPTKRSFNLNISGANANDKINIAVIGAGNFARTSHLPNIDSLDNDFKLRAIVNRTGPSGLGAGKQFGADYISTEPMEVIEDKNIDAVVIATRHDTHGPLALKALAAGKHVLVEKPTVLEPHELQDLKEFYEGGVEDKPILLTGYNRRFSPYAAKMGEVLKLRNAPFMINYRMNAGFFPQEHWVHGPQGGGRNIGEACHIYDLFYCINRFRSGVYIRSRH